MEWTKKFRQTHKTTKQNKKATIVGILKDGYHIAETHNNEEYIIDFNKTLTIGTEIILKPTNKITKTQHKPHQKAKYIKTINKTKRQKDGIIRELAQLYNIKEKEVIKQTHYTPEKPAIVGIKKTGLQRIRDNTIKKGDLDD